MHLHIIKESSPENNCIVFHFTLVSSDRDPVTPQDDGRKEVEEEEVSREEVQKSAESLEWIAPRQATRLLHLLSELRLSAWLLKLITKN